MTGYYFKCYYNLRKTNSFSCTVSASLYSFSRDSNPFLSVVLAFNITTMKAACRAYTTVEYQTWNAPTNKEVIQKYITFLVSADRRRVFLSFSNIWKRWIASLWVLLWLKVTKARKTSPLNSAFKWLSPDIDSQPDFLHKEKKWYWSVWRSLLHSIN